MKRMLTLLSLTVAFGLLAAETPSKTAQAVAPLKPGEYDGLIAQVTGQLMQRYHYLQSPVDDTLAGRFLDRYLESYDGQKMLLLEPDVKQFEGYRTLLDDLTMNNLDVSPAYLIFLRFQQRLNQRHEYVMALLKGKEFEFNGDDRFLYNRKDAARPRTTEEAKALWLAQLRNEYLTEKLNLDKQKKPDTAKTEFKSEDAKKKQPAATQPPKSIHEQIVEKLTTRYNRVHDYFSKWDSDDVLQQYLSAFTRAYDPHSEYMGHSRMENFNISMRLSLFGIGAQLRDEDGYCTIVMLMPGPAMKSKKLKPGDKIVGVAQAGQEPVDVIGMKLDKVVELIRGEKGTEVTLTVQPAEGGDSTEHKFVKLVRDEIKLEDQEAKAKLIDLPNAKGEITRLGVIDLPSFYADFGGADGKPKSERKSTARDVAALLTKLKEQNVAGVVLDLRKNGGGSLEEAVRTTGLFIKQGPVVEVKNSLGDTQVDADTDPSILYDGPLIVLTSRYSASASEILAGALQDYGRALIVGEKSTHGKGTVQTLLELAPYIRGAIPGFKSDPGSVKLTIRKFYLPSGASTQLKGVVPDIILPSVNNHADIGEPELQNPLPWDTVPAAEFDRLNEVSPRLAALKKLSEARVAASKDFDYIREDIERYQKLIAERSVSLNEAQRRQEKQEAEDRVEARKQEILARKQAEPKTIQLTLKDAAQPGLPAAGGSTNLAQVAGSTINAPVPVKKTHDDDEVEEEKGPDVDAHMNEALQILADFIRLSGKTRVAVAAP